jgi:hydrogenase/urease accessory protein HupE
MMRRIRRPAAVAALALAPTFAFAHPDIVPHDHAGFLAGRLLLIGV